MASGDPVVVIHKIIQPDADYAPLAVQAGGSTPAEQVPVYKFDDTTIQYLDLLCMLVGYDDNGLGITLPWSSPDQTAGSMQWEAAIRALPDDDTENIAAAHTYQYNSVVSVTSGVATGVTYPVVTFTDGADMDNWADGQMAILRIRRNTGGTNTLSGDAYLWFENGLEATP